MVAPMVVYLLRDGTETTDLPDDHEDVFAARVTEYLDRQDLEDRFWVPYEVKKRLEV